MCRPFSRGALRAEQRRGSGLLSHRQPAESHVSSEVALKSVFLLGSHTLRRERGNEFFSSDIKNEDRQL